MTVKKETSRSSGQKNNGKKGHVDQLQHSKSTVKYTFERSKEDVENIETAIEGCCFVKGVVPPYHLI